MRINHNIMAYNTHMQYKISGLKKTKSTEILSSGLRINRAGDDASGLAVSEKMRALIRGLEQASRNIDDGISMVSTAEGGMQEIHNMLNRMRELAVQAATDSYDTPVDRQAIQQEIDVLLAEINDIAEQTEFNGVKLLTGREVRAADAVANQVQASVENSPVNNDGTFNFWATNEAGEKLQMLFGGSTPGTSHPSIRNRATDEVVKIWPLQNTVRDEGPPEMWNSTGTVSFSDGTSVDIIQHVSVVDNPSDIGGQSYKITYDVINVSAAIADFDFMFHVDTMLGDNDAAPFEVDGNILSQEATYASASIPSQINIYDREPNNSSANLFINGVITVKNSPDFPIENEPDHVNLAHYTKADDYVFVTYPDLPSPIGDSGYGIEWEDNQLAEGESFSMTTYFGVKNPPEEVIGSIDTVIINGSKDLIVHSGANESEFIPLRTYDCRTSTLGISDVSATTRENASESITKINDAIGIISGYRADAGARQNRLELTKNNVDNAALNLTAAESQVRDIDMAEQMTEYYTYSVLSQASTAMLAQANQMPQSVLNLIG